MSSLTVEFAFEIGDLVYFVDASHTESQTPRHFLIYGRVVDQFNGGMQLLYRISGYRELIPEITLTATMPPYEVISDADLDARQRDQRRKIQTEKQRRTADKEE